MDTDGDFQSVWFPRDTIFQNIHAITNLSCFVCHNAEEVLPIYFVFSSTAFSVDA